MSLRPETIVSPSAAARTMAAVAATGADPASAASRVIATATAWRTVFALRRQRMRRATPDRDRRELPAEDDDECPERHEATRGERRQRSRDQDLVGERVEPFAAGGHLVAGARDRTVDRVRERRRGEDDERQGVGSGCDEDDHGEDSDGTRESDPVREVHCVKTRSTTSPWRPRLVIGCPL